jgi:hypothetical protein
MHNAGSISRWTASTALACALIAFVLGSAPLSATLVLAIIAVPIAIVTAFFGTWRLSLITIYWAIAAFSSVPMSNFLPVHTDTALVLLALGGLALTGSLYLTYLRAQADG